MRRVHRQRREHREDLGGEFLPDVRDVLGGEVLRGGDQRDPALRERRDDILGQDVAVLLLQLAHEGHDGRELFFRRHAVVGELADLGGDLLPEARDPHLEELVQVGAEDREELDPLEQRGAGILRLVEHPAVELEPGQLPIDVERRRAEIRRRSGRDRVLAGGPDGGGGYELFGHGGERYASRAEVPESVTRETFRPFGYPYGVLFVAPGRRYLSIQSSTVSHQSRRFRALSTQCPSSGK